MITNEICVSMRTHGTPSLQNSSNIIFRTFIFHHKNGFSRGPKDNISSIIKQPKSFLAFSHMTTLLPRKLALPPPTPTHSSLRLKAEFVSLCRAKLKTEFHLVTAEEAEKILLEKPERSQSPWTSPSEWSHGGEGIRHGKGPLWSPYPEGCKHSSKTSLWEKREWGGVDGYYPVRVVLVLCVYFY